MLDACPVHRSSSLGWGVVWSQQHQRTESPESQKVTEQMSNALVRPQLCRRVTPTLHVVKLDGNLSVSSLRIEHVSVLLTTDITPPQKLKHLTIILVWEL